MDIYIKAIKTGILNAYKNYQKWNNKKLLILHLNNCLIKVFIIEELSKISNYIIFGKDIKLLYKKVKNLEKLNNNFYITNISIFQTNPININFLYYVNYLNIKNDDLIIFKKEKLSKEGLPYAIIKVLESSIFSNLKKSFLNAVELLYKFFPYVYIIFFFNVKKDLSKKIKTKQKIKYKTKNIKEKLWKLLIDNYLLDFIYFDFDTKIINYINNNFLIAGVIKIYRI